MFLRSLGWFLKICFLRSLPRLVPEHVSFRSLIRLACTAPGVGTLATTEVQRLKENRISLWVCCPLACCVVRVGVCGCDRGLAPALEDSPRGAPEGVATGGGAESVVGCCGGGGGW